MKKPNPPPPKGKRPAPPPSAPSSVYHGLREYCKSRGWPVNTDPLSTVFDGIDQLEKELELRRQAMVVSLKPGDVVVLQTKRELLHIERVGLKRALEKLFPVNNVCIIHPDDTLTIMSSTKGDAP